MAQKTKTTKALKVHDQTTAASLASQLHTAIFHRKEWEAEEKKLRDQLLDNMKKQGVKTVKLDDGTLYVRATRSTITVVDDKAADEWAKQNNCLKVDTAKALKIVRLRQEDLPKFFKQSDTEFLTIKTNN